MYKEGPHRTFTQMKTNECEMILVIAIIFKNIYTGLGMLNTRIQ